MCKVLIPLPLHVVIPLHPHSYALTDDGTLLLCKVLIPLPLQVHHTQHVNRTRRSSSVDSTPSIGGAFYLPGHVQQTHTPDHVPGAPWRHVHGDPTCLRCGKAVFATEMQCASAHRGGYGETQCYHKSCFRCAECHRGPLRPDDWVVDAESSELLCRAHFRARQELSGGGSGRASFSAPSC